MLTPTEEEDDPAELEAVDPTISISDPPVITSDIAAEALAVDHTEDKKEVKVVSTRYNFYNYFYSMCCTHVSKYLF